MTSSRVVKTRVYTVRGPIEAPSPIQAPGASIQIDAPLKLKTK